MTALTPAEAERLAKICAMFSSNHDGERASAAAMADCMVRKLGFTWPQVIRPNVTPCVEDMIATCAAGGDILTAWEWGFLKGIRGRQYLTQKQLDRLAEITAKVRAGKAAA